MPRRKNRMTLAEHDARYGVKVEKPEVEEELPYDPMEPVGTPPTLLTEKKRKTGKELLEPLEAYRDRLEAEGMFICGCVVKKLRNPGQHDSEACVIEQREVTEELRAKRLADPTIPLPLRMSTRDKDHVKLNGKRIELDEARVAVEEAIANEEERDSKSGRIRWLYKKGLTISEVARVIDCRYQMVFSVVGRTKE